MNMAVQLSLLVLIILAFCQAEIDHSHQLTLRSTTPSGGKTCMGTRRGTAMPTNFYLHHQTLMLHYANCTFIDGNLELTWLYDVGMDLSFLKTIREVSGYLLVSHLDIRSIVMPNLVIIRGMTTFESDEEKFALLVENSALHTLELPALREISNGNAGVLRSDNLVLLRTTMWRDEILTDEAAHFVTDSDTLSGEYPPCEKNCTAGCWGKWPDNCHLLFKHTCDKQCLPGRCFSTGPLDCCHESCVAGCVGPAETDCLACKYFNSGGVCKEECPKLEIYEGYKNLTWQPNRGGKLVGGTNCVDQCPDYLLQDDSDCVGLCRPGKRAVNGKCEWCEGPCPRTCKGNVVINATNVGSFKGCQVIEGSVSILNETFAGMHPEQLENFSTLKEITGFLEIQAFNENFNNLSYFRNLAYIRGNRLNEVFSSIFIFRTSLKSLNLQSLKNVGGGLIVILENRGLCYADSIKWQLIKNSTDHNVLIARNKVATACRREGKVCDNECSTSGCWGPGNNQCFSCANYQIGNSCLRDCNSTAGLYEAEGKICKLCDSECLDHCSGPGPWNCTRCRHVRDGALCTKSCPEGKYTTARNVCEPCHPNCVRGCNGPENSVSDKGCNACERIIINENNGIESCLRRNESCPSEYYEWLDPPQDSQETLVCRKCHPWCATCTGPGTSLEFCHGCTKYKLDRTGGQCVEQCPSNYYANNVSRECLPCSAECEGCRGHKSSDCIRCKNFKIAEGDFFNCVSSCPIGSKMIRSSPADHHCAADISDKTSVLTYILYAWSSLLTILISIAFLCYFAKRRYDPVENTTVELQLADLNDEPDDDHEEPLELTEQRPNLATLRLIKETELVRGEKLGAGSFGTVIKGYLTKSGSERVPVALKELHHSTRNNTKEFLDEAYIMASVDHPNLQKLIGVCLSTKMVLVTNLMPLGCLHIHLRKHKDQISSSRLMEWSAQIATGMAYLEAKRLVHRDLAARNVLLQSLNHVKITDFGLARLLDLNEGMYHAAKCKIPIRWAAVECLEDKIFTHKSDVWSYGVTLWELFTFGSRPYENITTPKEVIRFLKRGGRLAKPTICTVEIYSIMTKCWVEDFHNRPIFHELAVTMREMCKDPNRYLKTSADLSVVGHSSVRTTSDSSSYIEHIEQDEHPSRVTLISLNNEAAQGSSFTEMVPMLPQNNCLYHAEFHQEPNCENRSKIYQNVVNVLRQI